MKRRRSREYALQLLFQLDLTHRNLSDETLSGFWEGISEKPEVKSYTLEIVKNTLDNLDAIDAVIKKAAQNWSVERMAVIDRNILRAAAYEMIFRNDIPLSVAINEALEIAKKYSTVESASFINGILDKIAQTATTLKK